MRKKADPRRRSLLFVCRANRARSPLAARLLEAYAAEHRLRPAPKVLSSGLFARAGDPLLPEASSVLTSMGQDADHSARPFRLAEARGAFLVVTFERDLLRAIVRRDPELLGRTYMLQEIVRLSSNPAWDPAWNGSPELADQLLRMRPRTAEGDDETPDPVEGGRRAKRRAVELVVTSTRQVAPVLLGGPQSGPEAP